jgi:hypothetical protein
MSNKIVCMGSSILLLLTSMSISSAQEKCKISEAMEAANSTYTQQHVIDVGDLPGHQVRIFEVHRTFAANDKPNCEGLKRKDIWERGHSDYIDRNGRATGYSVTTFENGDKMFGQYTGTAITATGSDGSKQSTFTGVGTYVGGTGKYQSIHGFWRASTKFDPDKNVNLPQIEGEYWLEK